MVAHTFNTSTQEAEQVDHYEFNANLVYPSKFQADQDYMVKPCLKHRSWKWLAPARMTSCFPGGEMGVQRRWGVSPSTATLPGCVHEEAIWW